jgi:DNA-binding transcriptional LysR family regulator
MCERIQRLPMGPEGSVSIAMPFLLTGLLMGPVIASLRQSHPRIRVFVLDDSSLMVQKAMLERRADLGILVDTAGLQDLQVQPLATEPIYLCGHDAKQQVTPLLYWRSPDEPTPCLDFAHAAVQPLVLQSRRYSIRQAVEQAASTLQLSLNIVHEHDSARVIRSLYHCGAGFTFTPSCSLAESPQPQAAHSQWIVARVCQPDLQRHYHLARQPGRSQDAAVNVVQHALLEHAQTLIAKGHWQAQWLYKAP